MEKRKPCMCRGRVFCESWANGTAPLWGAVLRPSDYVSEAESELESRPAFLNSSSWGDYYLRKLTFFFPSGRRRVSAGAVGGHLSQDYLWPFGGVCRCYGYPLK